jgi:hypothetical protein
MFFAVLFLLVVVLIVVCFWRELAPCLAWAALQYHACPELLACLHGEASAAADSPVADPVVDEPVVDPVATADQLHVVAPPYDPLPTQQQVAVVQPVLHEEDVLHEDADYETYQAGGRELAFEVEARLR